MRKFAHHARVECTPHQPGFPVLSGKIQVTSNLSTSGIRTGARLQCRPNVAAESAEMPADTPCMDRNRAGVATILEGRPKNAGRSKDIADGWREMPVKKSCAVNSREWNKPPPLQGPRGDSHGQGWIVRVPLQWRWSLPWVSSALGRRLWILVSTRRMSPPGGVFRKKGGPHGWHCHCRSWPPKYGRFPCLLGIWR